MKLKNNLKDFRVTVGINQQDFGAIVGVSRQTISFIERGDYSPSVFLALRIAKYFNVSVEDIFTLEEEENEKS